MLNKEFNQLLFNAHLTIHDAIQKLGISKTTIKRYKYGKIKPKKITIEYLKVIAGDLSIIDKNYKGWILKNGEIISPENDTFSLKRLRFIQFTFGQLRELKITNSELIKQINILKKENQALKIKKQIQIASNDPVYKIISHTS